MCIGCHFMQPAVTDNEKKEIRICKSYAQKIYGNEDLEKPTTKFDSCGLYISGSENNSEWLSFTDGENNVVIPSKYPPFSTADKFFNEETFKPPFFKDHRMVIVEDGSDCFNEGIKLGLGLLTAVTLSLAVSF